MTRLLCWLIGHDTPRFERIAGRYVHKCGRCEASWPVLPSVAGIPEDFRPEVQVLKARAKAERLRRKAARATLPSIAARRRA